MKVWKGYWITLAGAVAAGIGLYLVKNAPAEGVWKTLPFILIGLGCGAFGHGLGELCTRWTLQKHPQAAKEQEIAVKDERNVAIGNMAKAKAFTMNTYVSGALLLGLALMGTSFHVIIPLVAAYLFVQFYAIYCRSKLEKEW